MRVILANVIDIVWPVIDINTVVTYKNLSNLSLNTELHHFSLCLPLNCSIVLAVFCEQLNLSLTVRENNRFLNF